MSGQHGALRGFSNVPHGGDGLARFGRMFPGLSAATWGPTFEASRAVLISLAETMLQEQEKPGTPIGEKEFEDENDDIPAGYTYLGQFIDHDITFDPASHLDRLNDPDALEDFRTPRLDLDSLYARGPADQPYLFSSESKYTKFLLGKPKAPRSLRGKRRPDLPRNSDNPARALIGDKRNDENKVVSQLHTLFLMFHNQVIRKLEVDFAEAQRLVRWHYQWIVLNDFLKRIVGPTTWAKVLTPAGPVLSYYLLDQHRYPYMPVEFAGAAYRFGHSLVRPAYSLNPTIIGPQNKKFARVPFFTDDSKPASRNNLNGFGPIPNDWGIDWGFFFGVVPARANQGLVIPQPSYRIDTMLVDPLAHLPEFAGATNPWERSLAARNLVRGLALRLPSGQAVAHRIKVAALTDGELWDNEGNLGDQAQARRQFFANHRAVLEKNAPLWYYVLREAEITTRRPKKGEPLLGGHHLGPVGGRIVAETLVGLAVHDGQSYLTQAPGWEPDPRIAGNKPKSFDMQKLIEFVDA